MIRLVPIPEASLNEIAQMAKSIWQNHYVPIIGEQQVNYMLNTIYNTSSLLKQIDSGQRYYFINNESENIGFLSVSINSRNDELFIHKFYILTRFQEKGVGTITLNNLYELFPQITISRLTVNRQNFKSINFYFKNGFVIEKIADFDIGNGYFMNDFVMVKSSRF